MGHGEGGGGVRVRREEGGLFLPEVLGALADNTVRALYRMRAALVRNSCNH